MDPVITAIENYLEEQAIPCAEALPDLVQIANIQDHLLRAALLQDNNGMVMVVFPNSHYLDLHSLCELTGRPLTPVSVSNLPNPSFLPSLVKKLILPFPEAYQCTAILGETLRNCDKLYLEPIPDDKLLVIDSANYLSLLGKFRYGPISKPLPGLSNRLQHDEDVDVFKLASDFVAKRVIARMNKTTDLPIMPEISGKLLDLRTNPDATVANLNDVIGSDPSLAAQVVSWARSPYYGYVKEVKTIEQAITKVLGYELVLNLAIGLAIGRSLQIPHAGPIGLHQYWRSAIFTASLTQELAQKLPREQRPTPGLAYLAGLLHNFGFLILGHSFPEQYRLLTDSITVNPHVSFAELQLAVFGVSYEQLGYQLLSAWNLPEEVLVCLHWHNIESYQGEHATIANLVLLATRLLKRINIGYAMTPKLPEQVLSRVDISEAIALSALERVLVKQGCLDELCQELAR